VFLRGFNDGRVSWAFGEVVEVGQMAVGADEESHDLLEGFVNGLALGILSDAGNETGEVRIYADSTEVAGKQVETSAGGQTVGCDLDIVDVICFRFFELGHPVLHPLGDESLDIGWVNLQTISCG